MLGLVAAHLLLRDKPSSKMLGEVTRNLVTLLGEDNPDVQAISLAVKGDGAPLRDMPMLRASWDIFVNASLRKPDLVPPDSLPANLAPYVLPAWPWLIWEAPEAGGQRRLNAKLLALRGYLEGGDRSRAVEPEAVDFAVPRQAAARGASLDAEEQAELAQALGVPRNVLDRLISDAGY